MKRLKNSVSEKAAESTIPFTLPSDSTAFFASKEADKYKGSFCKKVWLFDKYRRSFLGRALFLVKNRVKTKTIQFKEMKNLLLSE